MTRYGMVIDVKRCTGCYNCFLTCRDEYAGNDYPGYSAPQPMSGGNWTRLIEKERGQYPHVKVAYIPVHCNQCEEASCLMLDQTGAVYRRDDGIIMIDPVKAKGNKELVKACPYRQIEWNEELQLPQKCTFCAHLLDKGDPEPRCVESCPSGALKFGDLDDPNSEVAKLVAAGAAPMRPEYGLKDKVLYLNLPKKFVAGTVVCKDIDEVAIGANVTIKGEDGTRTMQTNSYGDFEFADLAENTAYTVTVEFPGYKAATVSTKTAKDIYVGEIALEK